MKKIITFILIMQFLMITETANADSKLTKINKNVCKNIKTNYKSEVMAKWSNGLTDDQDVLKEIDLNIKMLKKQNKITNGKIKQNIDVWIKTEVDTKNALEEQDIKLITNSVNLKISTINKFNKICGLGKNK
jgi:hypothetical protein